MFSIVTSLNHNPATGKASVTAKGHGKQRTVPYNFEGQDQTHGAAVGALLNVLTTAVQQAKIQHPSGRQRVRVAPGANLNGTTVLRWSIDV